MLEFVDPDGEFVGLFVLLLFNLAFETKVLCRPLLYLSHYMVCIDYVLFQSFKVFRKIGYVAAEVVIRLRYAFFDRLQDFELLSVLRLYLRSL